MSRLTAALALGCALALALAHSIAAAEAGPKQAGAAPARECFDAGGHGFCAPGEGEASRRRAGSPGGGTGGSIGLAGLPGPLVAKVREIQAACGSRVVSAYRRGARIPTGAVSNHALHRAVDVRGHPACIYARLRGWPGGYSLDYARAPGGPHVHISYNPGGMEWGARFVHRHGGRQRHASGL